MVINISTVFIPYIVKQIQLQISSMIKTHYSESQDQAMPVHSDVATQQYANSVAIRKPPKNLQLYSYSNHSMFLLHRICQ